MSAVERSLDLLQEEAKDLYLGQRIQELFEVPTSLEFLRDYVAKNVPVIIRSGTLDWPAITKWNSHYFRDHLADKDVVVAVTPNGYADGITQNAKDGKEYFVMPEEQTMTMGSFLHMLDDKSGPVPYIQKQNSNLTTDFKELLGDLCLDSLQFAYEAFNKEPDAVNFWMGDERAITSMHKDPYENIYCVVSGHKDFILIPPVSYHNVPRRSFPSAVFKSRSGGGMEIQPITNESTKEVVDIDWVDIDPVAPDTKKYPHFSKAIQYEFRINEGDMLYLPSLWYHHVRQSHKCIAVNFWFDMDYDARYCYYRMVEDLCKETRRSKPADV